MCQYHYVYASACQHADFYRVSYCDKAKALISETHDSHSSHGSGAADTDPRSRFLTSKQAPSSQSSSNNTHSQNQQQDITNMSALTHSEVIPTLPLETTLVVRSRPMPTEVNIVPRSITLEVDSEQSTSNAVATLHRGKAYKVHVDVPATTDSSVSVSQAHSNAIAELGSTSSLPVDHDPCGIAAQLEEDAQSIDPSGHHITFQSQSTTTRQQSPRYPIPAQWLSTPSGGPSLATAQRAKEREHKRDSASSSPAEVKTIRGKRSSMGLHKQNGTDSPTFLTKEALACVDSNITSPTTPPRSPTRSHRPAWQSPSVSPRRDSPRQDITAHVKLSPTRPTFLNAETAFTGHRRGASSVATSSGDTVFHDAEGSPVRSTTDSEQSFESAAEALIHDTPPSEELELNANHATEQEVHGPCNVTGPIANLSIIGRVKTLKSRLALAIPLPEARDDAIAAGSGATISAGSTSAISNSPSSPQSASSMSRIPRVPASSMRSAHAPTRSSILKKTQSLRSLTSNRKGACSSTNNIHQPQSLQVTTPSRHVRTLDSSNSTPIISEKSTSVVETSRSAKDVLKSSAIAPQIHDASCLHLREQFAVGFAERDSLGPLTASRASSDCTVKVSRRYSDPAAIDSAVVYSRKKTDALGMEPPPPFMQPPIIVMMAHKLDIGNLHLHDAGTSDNTLESSRSDTDSSVLHGDIDSVHSSHASDLRATAPEFVPQVAQTNPIGIPATPLPSQVDSPVDLLGSRAYELDMYGIPWFYYMYQVQTAYAQGFRNGRSKSPKKARRNNNRSSIPSQHSPARDNEAPGAKSGLSNDTRAASSQHQRRTDMPPPASTVPLALQPAGVQRENSRPPNDDRVVLDNTSFENSPVDPFARQLNVVDRHAALQNVTNRSSDQNVDLTAIQNANFPTFSYSNTPFGSDMRHTIHCNVQRQYNNRRQNARSYNGLYNYHGRGTVGVPVDAVPFPDPVAPRGRPQGAFEQYPRPGDKIDMGRYLGYSVPVGKEACGIVDIVVAAERGGGEPCNACAPDHPRE